MSGGPEVRCACGAINDVSFATCIRCGRDPRAPAAGGAAVASRTASVPTAEEQDDDARPTPPWAGLILGGLCTLVFVSQWVMAARRGEGIPIVGGGDFGDMLRAGVLRISPRFIELEPFRFVSAIFVHFGLLHFFMNMAGFLRLSQRAESLIGSSRTIIAFVVTGVFGYAASAAVQLLVFHQQVTTAGASGGILGVMGLVLGVMIRVKDPERFAFGANALFFGILFGFALTGARGGIAINNAAHLGGFVAGLAMGLAWGRRPHGEGWLTRAVAGLVVLVSVASLAAARQSALAALY